MIEPLTPRRFYFVMMWVPLVLPAGLWLLARALRPLAAPAGLQLLFASLLYGGAPYLLLAIAGLLTLRGQPEAEIRKIAVKTPLAMIVAWAAVPLLILAQGGEVTMVVALFVLGAVACVALGYLYVELTFWLRELIFGPFEDDLRQQPSESV
jgi:hypothetical protein